MAVCSKVAEMELSTTVNICLSAGLTVTFLPQFTQMKLKDGRKKSCKFSKRAVFRSNAVMLWMDFKIGLVKFMIANNICSYSMQAKIRPL